MNLDDSKELSLNINQDNELIMIEFIGSVENDNFKITDEIHHLIKLFNADFTLNHFEKIVVLRLIIEI